MAMPRVAGMTRLQFLEHLRQGNEVLRRPASPQTDAVRDEWLNVTQGDVRNRLAARTVEEGQVIGQLEQANRSHFIQHPHQVGGAFLDNRRRHGDFMDGIREVHQSPKERVVATLRVLERIFVHGEFDTDEEQFPSHFEIATRILAIAESNGDRAVSLWATVLQDARLKGRPREVLRCVIALVDCHSVIYGRDGALTIKKPLLKNELEAARASHAPAPKASLTFNGPVSDFNIGIGDYSTFNQQVTTTGVSLDQVKAELAAWLPEALKRIETDVADEDDKAALREALETVADEAQRPKTRLEMLGAALRGIANTGKRIVAKAGTEVATKVAVAQFDHALKPWIQGVEEAVKGLTSG